MVVVLHAASPTRYLRHLNAEALVISSSNVYSSGPSKYPSAYSLTSSSKSSASVVSESGAGSPVTVRTPAASVNVTAENEDSPRYDTLSSCCVPAAAASRSGALGSGGGSGHSTRCGVKNSPRAAYGLAVTASKRQTSVAVLPVADANDTRTPYSSSTSAVEKTLSSENVPPGNMPLAHLRHFHFTTPASSAAATSYVRSERTNSANASLTPADTDMVWSVSAAVVLSAAPRKTTGEKCECTRRSDTPDAQNSPSPAWKSPPSVTPSARRPPARRTSTSVAPTPESVALSISHGPHGACPTNSKSRYVPAPPARTAGRDV